MRNATLKRHAVLLLVDYFNPLGFEGGSLSRAAVRAAQRTARLKARLRKLGMPAVYANDNFGRWESEFAALVRQCQGMPGDVGKVARLLAPEDGDRSVLKPRHSAFYETPLEFLLQSLGAKCLVLTGVSADSCIMFTAHDAYLRKLDLWVPADCVASPAPAYTRAALTHVQRVLRASIVPSTASLPAFVRR
jgi:nicotinamidase-related amidase